LVPPSLLRPFADSYCPVHNVVDVAFSGELVNNAVAALLAVEFIDFETIMLLLGIMSFGSILRKSGCRRLFAGNE